MDYQYTLNKKRKGWKKKLNLFWRWIPVGRGGHKERGSEGVHGGCILYPYMKIEE
jgi:hypothetical protein